jgi:hypothetical protein
MKKKQNKDICEYCGRKKVLICPNEWTLKDEKSFKKGQLCKQAELDDLQKAYTIAIREINRLRRKLGYNK